MREAIINFCVSKKTTKTNNKYNNNSCSFFNNLLNLQLNFSNDFQPFFARGIQAKKAWKWPAKISCILI